MGKEGKHFLSVEIDGTLSNVVSLSVLQTTRELKLQTHSQSAENVGSAAMKGWALAPTDPILG